MDVEINQKTGKNISRHLNGIATRTQQVDSTNYNNKKQSRKCLSSVAGPEQQLEQIAIERSASKS